MQPPTDSTKILFFESRETAARAPMPSLKIHMNDKGPTSLGEGMKDVNGVAKI